MSRSLAAIDAAWGKLDPEAPGARTRGGRERGGEYHEPPRVLYAEAETEKPVYTDPFVASIASILKLRQSGDTLGTERQIKILFQDLKVFSREEIRYLIDFLEKHGEDLFYEKFNSRKGILLEAEIRKAVSKVLAAEA